MRADAYVNMHSVEQEHWWFVARRRILGRVLARFAPAGSISILEAGCGTGGNLLMLKAFGEVSALEPNDEARAMAQALGAAEIKSGFLPHDIPFTGPFNMVCAFDVVEHLDFDEASCRALGERLAPGGVGVFTVPAFQFLWSGHDEILHHKRRYTRSAFNAMLKRAGFEVVYTSYFNTILFPVVAAIRLLQKLTGKETLQDDTANLPSKPVNALLTAVFGAERWILPPANLPFGVSILTVVRRSGGLQH